MCYNGHTQKEATISDLPSERATQIVKDRQGTYGHPTDVYSKAAIFWEVVFGHEVTIHQVAECLALVKHAREINANYPADYRDNRDDYAGYANVAQMIHDRDKEDDSGHHQNLARSAQRVAESQLPPPDAPPTTVGNLRGGGRVGPRPS